VAKVTGRGADVLGHPMRSLAWLANRLGTLGRRLEPGEIVMTGSLPLPYWAQAGDQVEIEISGLGAVRVDFD
jgi:2-keto-4-pentenoate hydratase